MLKHLPVILLAVCIFGSTSSLAQASYQTNSSYDGSYRFVDVSSLDAVSIQTFPVPILFGVDYDSIILNFGDPRGGGSRSHEGQDIRALQGTPIVSPTKAIVTSVGTGPSAGKYVYTANPGGESLRYLHLDSIADIKPGDKLAVGDFIGTVGDTGNAPDGVYHLHLEVKNPDNEPTNPYERLSKKSFTQKQKMSFLSGILRDVKNPDEYAEFLVTHFADEFTEAKIAEYSRPQKSPKKNKSPAVDTNETLLEKLDELIALIPSVVPVDVGQGDTGVAVSLLQTYLIFTSKGPTQNALAGASATGYFGPITAAALREYQKDHDLAETGTFDTATKQKMS